MTTPLVLQGNCLPILRTFADNTIDAVVTDPPYALTALPTKQVVTALAAWLGGDRDHVPDGRGFMGAEWDAFVPPPAVWDEVLRVLKPGGYLLCFAGSRTVDLMGISIRLAGFQVRDGIEWIMGSGFPKSHDISKAIDKAAGAQTEAAKQWDGWGTALKPTHEPIIVAQKPVIGTIAANVLTHGTGGLNIGACRVPTTGTREDSSSAAGRWPTNIVLSHLPECNGACADGCVVVELDKQSGTTRSDVHNRGVGLNSSAVYGAGRLDYSGPRGASDAGGASRFYPGFRYQAKAPKSERPVVNGKAHPTVKPLALMRWLVKLVTPPGGTVLDPYAGSGTTGQAAQLEGFDSVLIERDPDAITYIYQRLQMGKWAVS